MITKLVRYLNKNDIKLINLHDTQNLTFIELQKWF